MKKRTSQFNLLVIGGLFSVISCPIFAGEQGDTTIINITGVLVDAPECQVNNNNTVDVSFGDDIITYQVDGSNYIQQINYTLTCNSLAQQGLTLTLYGEKSQFDSSLIKTDKTGLGIKLVTDSEQITPGKPVSFDYSNQPVIYAVPVAQNAETLTTGWFSGTATMVIGYQ